MYEEFQKIYDESVGRDAGKDKAEDKMWNRGQRKMISLLILQIQDGYGQMYYRLKKSI